ncbi:MAG: amidohydrolase family protein [Thermodesulfobacteriota bacterium]
MKYVLLKNCHIVDGTSAEKSEKKDVLIEDDRIKEIESNLHSASAEVIDLNGRTLMPGLIDCHVHVIAISPDLGAIGRLPDSYVTAHSLVLMHNMLMRGFTTVRDVGGADHGLVQITREGLFPTPRVLTSGKALSQTGGHCDFRGRYDTTPPLALKIPLGDLGRICDGETEIRRAAREEIKGGADFIKIMASGGCASPTDPIHYLGFSRQELLAVVEEAANAGTYVAAHLYTDQAIRRCVECGVHSLEHCNLIEKETADLAAERGAFAVPTLVTYDKLVSEGAAMGFPAESVEKVKDVHKQGLQSLMIMKEAGLTMAYGSDLLGDMQHHQSEEFVIRGKILPAQEVIASATIHAAKLLRMEGLVGTVSPNTYADLIVVDGNPLEDLSLLTQQGRHIPIIMKGGQFVKCEQN